LGALILVGTFVVAVVGYHLLEGYSWIDAVWMVVITISSVGYAEKSELGDGTKVFTIAVIVFGMSAAFYTIGGLLQMLTEGELERALGHRRMTRDIQRLKDHVIICGFGRMGEILAGDLQRMRRPYVVIDHNSDRILEAGEQQHLSLNGDATEEQTLVEAGIEQARTLVSGLPSDADNVFIALTSRNLNADLQIVARAEHVSTEKKLRQAGADRVVMPALVGARQMSRLITRPSTADLIELVTETSRLNFELDEIDVPETSRLAGMTVRETAAHRQHGLLVVAVKDKQGHMELNPDAGYVFQGGDIVILMGYTEHITGFRKEFGL
jgi:voltage-gated potassium channel